MPFATKPAAPQTITTIMFILNARQCGQTNCLQVEIPGIKLPHGYQAREINLLIQGVCGNCG
jgi:Fe2+ or Zn2+ uptake regulation protein